MSWSSAGLHQAARALTLQHLGLYRQEADAASAIAAVATSVTPLRYSRVAEGTEAWRRFGGVCR